MEREGQAACLAPPLPCVCPSEIRVGGARITFGLPHITNGVGRRDRAAASPNPGGRGKERSVPEGERPN